MSGGCHSFDDIAGKYGVGVSIEGYEAPVLFVRGEKTGFTRRRWFEFEGPIRRLGHAMHRKARAPFIDYKGARVFFLIDDIWIGAGCHHHRARREFDFLARVFPLPVDEDHSSAFESLDVTRLIEPAGCR